MNIRSNTVRYALACSVMSLSLGFGAMAQDIPDGKDEYEAREIPLQQNAEPRNTINVILHSQLGGQLQNKDFSFCCDYLRLTIKGTFAGDFHYTVRQRLNKGITDGKFLDATDYLNITWKKNNWEVGAGKFCLAFGGFDYNKAGYDIFIGPESFSGMKGMYNYALRGAYNFKGENYHQMLRAEFGNSIYAGTVSNLLGYSLQTSGKVGIWENNCSVNFHERAKGKYNNFISLGNIWDFDRFEIQCDLEHRLDMARPTFFKDFSVIGRIGVRLNSWAEIHAKATWDYMASGVDDPCLGVLRTTSQESDDFTAQAINTWKAGGGAYFYPIKEYRNLRLHLIYQCINSCQYTSPSEVTEPSAMAMDTKHMLQIGFTWALDIYSTTHKQHTLVSWLTPKKEERISLLQASPRASAIT